MATMTELRNTIKPIIKAQEGGLTALDTVKITIEFTHMATLHLSFSETWRTWRSIIPTHTTTASTWR